MVRRKVFISTPHGRYNKFSLGIKKVLSPCLDLLYRQIIRHKKQDTADKPHYGNVPFEVPDSWEWCKLGTVNEIARGGSPRPIKDYLTNDASGINWIKIGDTTKDGKYIDSVKERIRPEGVKKSRMVHKGDFLLTNSMSLYS